MGEATGPSRATRPRVGTTDQVVRLSEGWELTRTDPLEFESPSNIRVDSWSPAVVPGTVAEAVGPDSLDGHPDYDRFDWWYRCTFEHAASSASRHELRFDGLATLAEVWLNGSKILDSANMFVTHSVDVTDHLEDTNELWIAFRSLTQHLAGRRPRPRWKTKLVGEQKLRWVRTTLLGRIPGWTPQVLTVGPWRDVSLAAIGDRVRDIAVEASVKDGVPRVSIRASLSGTPDECVLVVGDAEFALEVENGRTLDAHVDLPDAELWWPHTHGEPTLHPLRLRVRLDGETVDSDLGRVGFRTVTVDRTGGREQLVVNDVPVFARGACWTSNDVISLVGAPDEMRETLERAVGANANMVRVGGTMVYETESFYDACDELGLMVWQDFMFANMDYPVDDPDFSDSIMHEAGQQATRLARHASVVCFCGGSEVEQQAAMFGAPREVWTNDFFSNRLPELVADVAHVPYWPSTPTGGVLPFHVGEGLGHYYGVGAYRRPLEDARLSAVKFSPECLGFSNIPERGALRELGHDAAPHTPVWKAGVARDSSAGWDFEDIRDHYMRVLFGVDPVELRATDLDRYIRLGRVTTGRVMARVFDEWRSPEHPCAGGLVWFLKDLRPGAGWGLIDSGNRAKPALHYMRRAWAPRRVTLLDRGLDGVRVEVHNEPDEPLTGTLELTIYGLGSEVLATTTLEVRVEARSTEAWSLEEELGRFLDPNWAYRFGPLRHAAIAATLSTDDSESSTVLWPKLAASLPAAEIEAEIDASRGSVHSATLARDVALDLKGGEALDNYFDLLPGRPKTFSVDSDGERPSGYAEAENLPDGVRIRTPE